MFSFQVISVLLISITFYTYLSNIVFWCDLAFKSRLYNDYLYHNLLISNQDC